MNRAVVSLVLALGLAAGALSVTALSLRAHDAGSAFTGDGTGAGALVAQARGLSLETRRLAAGPLGLGADPRLDPAHTLLVSIAPERPYTAEEQARVESFVRAGGRLLVADAFGEGSTLTAPFGITFERVRLVESNATAVAQAIDGHAFPLDLGEATTLRLSSGAAAAAQTSSASFLDRDGDGLIGVSDPHGPFPIVAEATLEGGGLVLAVADPTLLAPAHDTPHNTAWRQALLQHALPAGGTILVDESRAGTDDPLLAGLAAVSAAAGSLWGAAAFAFLALVLLAACALPRARETWRRHEFRPNRFIRRAPQAAAPEAPAAQASSARASSWTPRGAAALLGAPALALVALAEGSLEAAWAAALLGVAAAAALLPGPPRVAAVRRLEKAQVPEGGSVPVELVLESRGRAEVEVLDALPPEFDVEGETWFRARLGRGETKVPYTAKPALRGPYEVGPLRVRRTDPLQLHVHEVAAAPAHAVQVTPRKQPLNRVPFSTRIPSITLGPHLVNRAGDGSEFHSLREYQEGDAFRSINWRASARSTQLVVSQRVHESMTTVTLFLDARAVSGAGPAAASPLADGCRSALSLASGALQVRDKVRFVAYGEGVQELAGRGARQGHDLADLLAALPAKGTTGFGEAVAKVLSTLQPGTPVLLFSGLEADPSIPEAMRQLRARGLLPLVVASPIGTAPAHADEGGAEPDAEAIKAGRQATVQALRAAGIPLLETIPGVPLDHLFRLGGVT
jgi:uncharacterized protein (DUF58 family)